MERNRFVYISLVVIKLSNVVQCDLNPFLLTVAILVDSNYV